MDSDAIRKRAEEVADQLVNSVQREYGQEVWITDGHDAGVALRVLIAKSMLAFVKEMVEAVPEKPMNPEITITETGHELYRAGWNACRAEMMKGTGNG